MSGFSGTVKLGDLNDFINPAQACVNPLFTENSSSEKTIQIGTDEFVGKAAVSLQYDLNEPISFESGSTGSAIQSEPNLIKTSANNTAKVSLSDCLACSGCVTSAETVLLEQQSINEFKKALSSSAYDKVIVTISAQSRASITTRLFPNSSIEQAHKELEARLKRIGVEFVLDTSVGTDIAQVEAAEEFVSRYKNRGQSPGWKSPPSSVANSSTETRFVSTATSDQPEVDFHGGFVGKGYGLPLLTSSCPGWICFAEKTHPEAIPYISTVKSPQQITSAIVKHCIGDLSGTPPNRIYHAAVMPCADKKLEASRNDFLDANTAARDTDCVLTTIEFLELIETVLVTDGLDEVMEDVKDSHCSEKWRQSLNEMNEAVLVDGKFAGSALSDAGSGGQLDYVFRVAAKQLFNVEVPAGPLPLRQRRNIDCKEIELQVGGVPVLRFALAYGFRNIQRMIRLIKSGRCQYDFIEIMACPGGCINGGGQLRPVENLIQADELRGSVSLLPDSSASRIQLAEVSRLFHDRVVRLPLDNPFLRVVYRKWVNGDPYSDTARRLLHTRYHSVPKLEGTLLEKW